eukprot:c2504_g1_i1.p1 GENE.c2504_g1_i1~~c2504_g1_i1.p1  ORF type:complete len:432 (-),score=87.14 c2504_g1_i1:32-1327(-)
MQPVLCTLLLGVYLAHASIIEFVRSAGGAAHPSLIAPRALNSLSSSDAIPSGSELLKIPSTLAFTSRGVPQGQLRQAVLTYSKAAQLEPRLALVLTFIEAIKGSSKNNFATWFDLLPRSLDVPLMYTEDELAYLDRTDGAARVRSHVQSVTQLYDEVIKAGGDKFGVTKPDFLFAFALVSGWRTIVETAKSKMETPDPSQGILDFALLPGMTSAGHCNTPNAALAANPNGDPGTFFDTNGGDFVMVATADIPPNTPICIDYGFSTQYEGFTSQGVVQQIDELDSITLVVEDPGQAVTDALAKLSITKLEFVLTPTSMPLKLLNFLRIKHGANVENPEAVALLQKGSALTLENDRAALGELNGALRQIASGWGTTLDEDYQKLSAAGLTARQRRALEFRIREKRVVMGALSITKDLWSLWILPEPKTTNPKQ